MHRCQKPHCKSSADMRTDTDVCLSADMQRASIRETHYAKLKAGGELHFGMLRALYTIVFRDVFGHSLFVLVRVILPFANNLVCVICRHGSVSEVIVSDCHHRSSLHGSTHCNRTRWNNHCNGSVKRNLRKNE